MLYSKCYRGKKREKYFIERIEIEQLAATSGTFCRIHYLEEQCICIFIYLAGEEAFPEPGGYSQICELFMSTHEELSRMDYSANINLKNILVINCAVNNP